MPFAYAKDVYRINGELNEEVNGKRLANLASMECLQARRVMVHAKRNFDEAEQNEKNKSWKQKECSAAHRCRSVREEITESSHCETTEGIMA